MARRGLRRKLVDVHTDDTRVKKLNWGTKDLIGSEQDDVYFLNSGDINVIEGPNGGVDTVITLAKSYTLGDHIENLAFFSMKSVTGVGNALDNKIWGGLGDDRLFGLGGNDTIAGGWGNDLLDGGTGEDTAVYEQSLSDYDLTLNADGTVTVAALNGNEGTDTLVSIENVTFANGTFALSDIFTPEAPPQDLPPVPEPDNLPGDQPKELWVGEGENFRTLDAAVAASGTGDTIFIRAGQYEVSDLQIAHDLSIVAVDGVARLVAGDGIKQALIVSAQGVNLHLEGLDLSGTYNGSTDVAAIWHLGENLSLVDSFLHDNQMGLYADAGAEAEISVTRTEFSGHGSESLAGHALFVESAAQLNVTESHFQATQHGDHLRTGALQTIVSGSVFDDAGMGGLFAVNSFNGGSLSLTGNSFVQTAGADDSTFVHYDGGSGSDTVNLDGNTFYNFSDFGIGLQNLSSVIAQVRNNSFVDNTGTLFTIASGQADLSGNSLDTATGVEANADSYRLNEDASVTFNPLANDVEATDAAVTAMDAPQHGTVEDNGDGTFTYTPWADWSGSEILSYTVTNASGQTATSQITLTTNAVADKPILNAGSNIDVTMSAEGVTTVPLTIDAALTDTDGSEQLRVIVSGLPSGAALSAGVQNSPGVWILSPQDLDGLMLDLPATVVDDFTLQIVAEARESSNGSLTTVSGALSVFVTAAAAEEPAPPPSDGFWVGEGQQFASLKDAVAASSSGDTIYLMAGTYDVGEVNIPHDLTIKGFGGEVVLTSSTQVAKGLLVTLAGVNLTVEGLTFEGASSPDRNGAGIRHQGEDLTVINSSFIGNEDGILGTGSSTGTVTITGSTFDGNGYGDGRSHGIYVIHVAELIIDDSTFTNTKVGHHVKSLAEFTSITNSVLDDAGGTASYNVDVTRGGDLYIADSILIQSAATQNRAMIYYSTDRGGEAGSITIVDNEVINYRPNGLFLNNTSGSNALIQGNSFTNDSGGGFTIASGPATIIDEPYGSGGGDAPPAEDPPAQDSPPEDPPAEDPPAEDPPAEDPPAEDPPVEEPPASDPPPSDSTGGNYIAPQPTGSIGGVDSDGQIRLDSFLQPQQPGDVVGFRLINQSGETQGADIMTIGHVFAQGDVPAGSDLVATINGQTYAVQMDVKATYADGSVRHAVLTLDTPAMASSEVAEVMFSLGDGASGAALGISDILNSGYDFDVSVSVQGGGTVNIDVAQLLQQASQNGTLETWMSGPLSSEFSVSKSVAQNLDVQFNVQVFADGDIRTDVIFQNHDAFSTAIRDITYGVTMRQDGQVVFSQSNIQHHRSSNWHKEVWRGDNPDLHYQHDVWYMMSTGAIPNYDLTMGVGADTISQSYAYIENSDTGPLGNAGVTQYMPMTGGRGDIGILPEWTVEYLVTQDALAKEVMLANADAAGSAPWHIVDESTGEAISIWDHPDLWVDSRNDTLPDALYASGTGGWSIDTAHQPSLSYIPYLVTGNQYYLDNLVNQAATSVAMMFDRDEGNLVFLLSAEQTRSKAWTLRTLSEATFAVPDDHALSDYFDAVMDANLNYAVQQYVINGALDGAGELEGYFPTPYGGGQHLISPWQQDFLALSLALTASRGHEQAEVLSEWMNNFTSGRWTNEENGYDPFYGAPYRLQFERTYGDPIDTWAEAFAATGLGSGQTSFDNAYDSSYTMSAKAALAQTITATLDPDAVEAYGFIITHTYGQDAFDPNFSASFYDNPTWNVVPQLPDGTFLTNDLTTVGSGTITGSSYSEMLIGGNGNDTLSGLAGIDLIFGNGAADTLRGGDGDDFLYGGDGNDWIKGDFGSDFLKGGQGQDKFVFFEMESATDTIADFEIGVDKILISQTLLSQSGQTVSSLLNGASFDGTDGLIQIGDLSIKLIGVDPDNMSSSDFSII